MLQGFETQYHGFDLLASEIVLLDQLHPFFAPIALLCKQVLVLLLEPFANSDQLCNLFCQGIDIGFVHLRSAIPVSPTIEGARRRVKRPP